MTTAARRSPGVTSGPAMARAASSEPTHATVGPEMRMAVANGSAGEYTEPLVQTRVRDGGAVT
ncbi:hypothetical protein ACJ65_09425 [Kocuria rhizophila]|nr:hypothetical protein ACJ65_09425 [Kocuria rhizophila]